MFVNLPGLIFIVTTCCMIGIIMLAFYKDCHPISYGVISKTDQLVPLYVMDILGDYPGLPGIFVSCVISGSLSSLSSGLNALSAVTLRDILQQSHCVPNLNEFKSTILSKGLVFFYGVFAIALAYVVSNLGSVLQAVYTIFGILNGPLLGVFTLGMFFPWANKHGAFTGMIFSLGFLTWVGIAAFVYKDDIGTPASPTFVTGCNFTARPSLNTPTSNLTSSEKTGDVGIFTDLYRMSYMYYTPLGMILVHGVAMFVSLLTGLIDPKTLDPRLICPLVDEMLPCLPEKIRKPFRFGIIHEGKYENDRNREFQDKPSFPIRPSPTSNGKSANYPVSENGKDNFAFKQDENIITKTRL